MVDSKDKPAVLALLTKQLYQSLDTLNNVSRYVIALSGGIDSVVLTHLLSTLPAHYSTPIIAVHINHGLDKDADRWQAHCADFCQDLNIEFITDAVLVNNAGKGLEAAARELRYAALARHLEPGDALFTAHHQQDQAETVLLNLFRGAGVDGLAGMPMQKAFQAGLHVRPLLNVSKAEIESYAEHHQLTWITDPSNRDVAFTRNYVRHSLLPNLRQRWNQADQVLSRTAQNMGQASELLKDLALLDLAFVADDQQRIKLDEFSDLSVARQRNVLRYWLGRQQLIPSSAQLDVVTDQCINAAADATPVLELGDHEIRRYRDRLYLLLRRESSPALQSYRWNLKESLELPELDLLLDPEWLLSRYSELSDDGEVEVRFRQGGEKFKADVQGLKKSLKNYFQEAGVPPWERDRLPLIYNNDELIAVWGYSLSNH